VAPAVLLWHRDDLRLRDNPALAAATDAGTAHPCFVFDPRFYTSDRVCDGRIEFLHESLEQLREAYRRRGGALALRHGDPHEVCSTLLSEGVVDRVYFNATTTSGYARERDRRIAELDGVSVFGEDGIVRTPPTRERWSERAEAYFEGDRYDAPGRVGDGVGSTASIDGIAAEYGVDSEKRRRHRGGCRRARRRLAAFVRNAGEYVGAISPPAAAEERSSNLSPYFASGCLSLREAYQRVREGADDGRAIERFTSRLFWNRHFTQKLADDPDSTERAINPVFRGMNRGRHDPELAEAWRRGKTGYPLVDAAMRALVGTGWLNFRMRAMCASFYTYILGCWWKRGADFFYRHLVDADPGINYQQWQMQSGLVGVHPLRIYNPRKQLREKDPDGRFVRRYVPELEPFPTEHLDRPERAPADAQAECGVEIGADYPHPIVEFEPRRAAAADRWRSLGDRASEALEDPEIERRASFTRSGGRGGEEIDPPRGDRQAGLDEFGG